MIFLIPLFYSFSAPVQRRYFQVSSRPLTSKEVTDIFFAFSTHDKYVCRPCILIFDSLPGRSRTNIVATLREYLAVEHLERKGVAKVFSKDTIKGTYLKVPQQMNFSDCGLFTLQFAQSFIEVLIVFFFFFVSCFMFVFEESFIFAIF